MDSRLLLGVGVSFIFGFLRWRFPAVPKPLATFGSMIGIGLLLWAVFPDFDWRWAAVLIAVAASVAAVLDALMSAKSASQAKDQVPTSTIDQRVTSHGQTGGITARNVSAGDDQRI